MQQHLDFGLAQNQRRARVQICTRCGLQNRIVAGEISQDTAALALEIGRGGVRLSG
jgi:hypothetical protein